MIRLRHLFWNRDEGRPRSFWRIALAAVMATALSLLPLTLLPLITTQPHVVLLVAPSIILIGTLVSVWIAARLLDHRPMADFGLSLDDRWWRDLGFGLVLGASLITAIFLVEWAAGWVTLGGWLAGAEQGFATALPSLVVLFVCVGIYEEVAFRGYVLRNLAEGFNFRSLGSGAALLVALLLTSGIFGAVHAGNPSASVPSGMNTVLSGILLGLGFVLTGRLAIPIGFHITWNFFQGPVFGFPVSGVGFGESLFATTQQGPVLWTGGDYGPEGGLVATATVLVGIGLLLGWVRFHEGAVSMERSLAQPPPANGPAQPSTAHRPAGAPESASGGLPPGDDQTSGASRGGGESP